MTENEAKRILDGIDEVCGDLPEDGNEVEIALMMAKDALDEIQSYRAIGTIEEFKALKEKSEPKKPLFSTVHGDSAYHCSSCKKFVGFYDTRIYEYCHNCGQALDWNE